LVANAATRTLEPDKSDPGSVIISKGSCSIWDLAMWPAGSIAGTVRDSGGKPLSGVTVQAFAFDSKNERESSPLRTATTDSDGRYTLDRVPPGPYAIGVNARRYNDENAYPPTLYAGGSALYVAESHSVDGIDLVLPPSRVAARLRVTALDPDGRVYAGAIVQLENLQGVQRWFSHPTDAKGQVELPAYLGEHYIVRAFNFTSRLVKFEGVSELQVTDENPSMTIVLRQEIEK
jgi:hypothetical protein